MCAGELCGKGFGGKKLIYGKDCDLIDTCRQGTEVGISQNKTPSHSGSEGEFFFLIKIFNFYQKKEPLNSYQTTHGNTARKKNPSRSQSKGNPVFRRTQEP